MTAEVTRTGLGAPSPRPTNCWEIVMCTRGYPVGDFEQRAADIPVAHPLVLKNYRTAHQSALRQSQGQANTEELRQAMIR